jgi:hypothetical protein
LKLLDLEEKLKVAKSIQKKNSVKDGGTTQVVEHLSSKHKALSSNPNTTKTHPLQQ